MTSSPYNPFTNDVRFVEAFVVRLGDEDGTAPGSDDEVLWLQPKRIVRSAGGRRLDYCEFVYSLAMTGERLVDLTTPTGYSRQVEIRMVDELGLADAVPIFWGEITKQTVRLSDRDESATLVARIEPYHFGSVLTGPVVYDPTNETEVTLNEDVRFNPEIDGTVEGNRNDSITHSTYGYWLWIDPESVRTAQGQTLQGANADTWDLDDALYALAYAANPTETFIRNFDQLADPIFRNANEVTIKNMRLRRGEYLPDYLDDILHPHGYDWFVALDFDPDDNSMRRRIRVFKRGIGPEKQVYFQRPGEALDLAETNVSSASVTTSIADLANEIVGHGSKPLREVTIELRRGWPASQDSLTANELSKKEGDQYADNPDAWRLLVGNEAGDYNGTRPEITEALDLSSVFDTYVPRRRKIGDCLTLDSTGKRRKPFVEVTTDGWVTSKQITSGFEILKDQIGIRFTGTTPPDEEFVQGGSDAYVRITGTIEGDTRLAATASRQDTSPNARTVTLFLDVGDRFHDRSVLQTGALASELAGDAAGADERDDAAALLTYLESFQDIEEPAELDASIELAGIHLDYEIGDLITKIDGRNISFNRNAETAEAKRYLQIFGLTWDQEKQRTILDVRPTDPVLA